MKSSEIECIFIAVTVLAGLAYSLFSDRTKSSRASWARAKENFLYTSKEVEERIESAKMAAAESCCQADYRLFRELRRESIAVSNDMYKQFSSIRKLLQNTHDEIKQCSNKIHELGAELDRRDLDMNERKVKYEEYKDMINYRKSLYEDLNKNKNDYYTIKGIVDTWNHKTHSLNESIRDHCGYDGESWYVDYMHRKQSLYSALDDAVNI